MRRKIFIYDTTLHDSPEWPARQLPDLDKRAIARELDLLGVDYIEIPFKVGDPAEEPEYRALLELPLTHARMATSVRMPDASGVDELESWLASLQAAGAPTCTIIVNRTVFSKADNEEFYHRFLEDLKSTISSLVDLGKEVFVEIEDFFDGIKQNPFHMDTLIALLDGSGAKRIVLNETSGHTLPWEAGTMIHELVRKYPDVKFGIHFHDLGHSAIAGALTAVDQGVVHVQGSINGFGSRSGEANLCNIIPDLELKMGYECLPEGNLPGLLDVAQFLMGTSSESPESGMRYVGRSELNPI